MTAVAIFVFDYLLNLIFLPIFFPLTN
jgi:hypothetical protein